MTELEVMASKKGYIQRMKLFFFTYILMSFSFNCFAMTDLEQSQKDLEESKTSLTRYQNAFSAFRLVERRAEEARSLEKERALQEQRVKYEALLNKKDQKLAQYNRESLEKSEKYKPIKIQYSGGKGLRNWTRSTSKKQKN